MKEYTVTQVYHGKRDFQHIEANSREEAIEKAKEMNDWDEWVNETSDNVWFAEIEEIDAEPVGNPDKMTLTELAHEWRKIIKFKYLAYGEIFAWGGCYPVLTTGVLPLRLEVRDVGGEGAPCYIHEWISDGVTNGFLPEDLAVSIDLSEYADENGNIDYSKCIVEVEE